jgi:hypothetical protein
LAVDKQWPRANALVLFFENPRDPRSSAVGIAFAVAFDFTSN